MGIRGGVQYRLHFAQGHGWGSNVTVDEVQKSETRESLQQSSFHLGRESRSFTECSRLPREFCAWAMRPGHNGSSRRFSYA
jgi:hypothetical protein